MRKNEGEKCHNFSPKMIDGSYACIAPVGGQCTHNYQLLYPFFVCHKAMGTVRLNLSVCFREHELHE